MLNGTKPLQSLTRRYCVTRPRRFLNGLALNEAIKNNINFRRGSCLHGPKHSKVEILFISGYTGLVSN